MALTNIELYEALKKDLSEDSARMIAEVFPAAGELTTKSDFAALRSDVEALRADFQAHARATEARLAQTDRRVHAFGLALLIPLWGAMVMALVKYFVGI